jgi:hypothetical protein
MKRTLAIAVLCMLCIATVGTTAVSATAQAWTPRFYQFDVKSDATSRVIGKVVINTMSTGAPTFYFYGYKVTPGTTYYLYYTTPTGRHDVGSAVANKFGTLYMKGEWTNPVADLQASPTFMLTTQAGNANQIPTSLAMYFVERTTVLSGLSFLASITLRGTLTDQNGVGIANTPIRFYLASDHTSRVVDDSGRYVIAATDQNGNWVITISVMHYWWPAPSFEQTMSDHKIVAYFGGDATYAAAWGHWA